MFGITGARASTACRRGLRSIALFLYHVGVERGRQPAHEVVQRLDGLVLGRLALDEVLDELPLVGVDEVDDRVPAALRCRRIGGTDALVSGPDDAVQRAREAVVGP